MNMLNKEDARPKDKLATNIFRVIGYYILALIPSFGLFMVRRGNVKDSIMVHMLNNGIATAFIIIPFVYLLIF